MEPERRVPERRSAPARTGSGVQPRARACRCSSIAPLVLGARTLGWVALSTYQIPECDGQWRVVLLEAIARQATLALHQSRLAELNRLEERRKAILEERNRLARDIHDNLAQGFAAILMQLQAARREVGTLPPAVASSLETAVELARTHLAEARRSVVALRPNVGNGEDVATAIKRLADLGQRTTDVPIEVIVDELPRFGDGVEREIIGIAQEALTNAVRHSRARRITIRASTVQIDWLPVVGGRRWPRDRARAVQLRIRHDEHAGARRANRRLADDRDRAAKRDRSRAGLGAVFRAHAGPRCQLTPSHGSAGKARVLLVDDHALLRTGVANIINQEPDLRVVAEAGNGVEAIEAYQRHHPDVTLLDLRMPVMEGVEAVRRIRELDPRARVIVLTTYDTDEEISRALKAGAKAYVLKDISADDLITCIRDVLAGKTYLAPAAAAKLAEGVTRVQLTPRELATLQLMADGKANKEIATALGISERTVKTHLGHLFEKLGVTSRTEAIGVATRRGLVRLE